MRSPGDWKNVQVLGIGHLAAAVRVQLHAALAAGGADFENDSSDPPLLVCSDFPNAASFRDANARALACGGRVAFAALTPAALWLGPVVERGRPGCFECVEGRLHRLVAPGAGVDPKRGARIGANLIVQVVLGHGATPYRGTLDGACLARWHPGAAERRTGGGAGCPTCSGPGQKWRFRENQ